MAINKTTLLNQFNSMLSSKTDVITFSPIIIDDVKVNRLGFDDNEIGILSEDGSWFFPLSELTINELKSIKAIIKGNI